MKTQSYFFLSNSNAQKYFILANCVGKYLQCNWRQYYSGHSLLFYFFNMSKRSFNIPPSESRSNYFYYYYGERTLISFAVLSSYPHPLFTIALRAALSAFWKVDVMRNASPLSRGGMHLELNQVHHCHSPWGGCILQFTRQLPATPSIHLQILSTLFPFLLPQLLQNQTFQSLVAQFEHSLISLSLNQVGSNHTRLVSQILKFSLSVHSV